LRTTAPGALVRRVPAAIVVLLALGSSGALRALPAGAAPGASTHTSLATQQSTHGAAGGPFAFQLTSRDRVATEVGSTTPTTTTPSTTTTTPITTATTSSTTPTTTTTSTTPTSTTPTTTTPTTTTTTAMPADRGVRQPVVALVPQQAAVPLAIARLDCSGGVIYQVQRASTGSTNGKLNAIAVGAMSGTNPVSATQATTSLIPQGLPNALGITAGGLGAWALAPQTAGGILNTLVFTLWSFATVTNVWTQHTANIDTTGRLPSGVTAASIRSGGIVAGAIDPLSGNYYWASLASAPTNSLTIFGWNTTTNQPIGVVANSTLPQNVPARGAPTATSPSIAPATCTSSATPERPRDSV
jgi:hypothetical protein